MSPHRSIVIFVILISLTCAKRFGSFGHSSHKTHSYPHSTGFSGNNVHVPTHHGTSNGHSYPTSTGFSGNTQHGHQQPSNVHQQPTNVHQRNTFTHTSKTEVHHHYHYNPPQHITYGSQTLPVYHGSPPIYVYQYRDSGSRFDNLLTGLALYNLGKMSAHHHHDYHDRRYESRPGEVCKLGIRKSNGDYEETRINCEMMSSFIWEAEAVSNQVPKNTNTIRTSVVNQSVTTINGTTNSTVTVTNTTVVDALEVKGPSIKVTPDMTCYLIRTSRDYSTMKKTVDCGILQTYASSSMRRNASARVMPFLEMLVISIAIIFYSYVK